MSKNTVLQELLDMNIEIKGSKKMVVNKVRVLPNNFVYDENECIKNGAPNMYQKPSQYSQSKAKFKYSFYSLYAWCKKDGESTFIFKAIRPTVQECPILAPIVRKVDYINSIVETQRSFSINKYVDFYMKETDVFLSKLFEDVNKDCLNPWLNLERAKREDKELKKQKKKAKDE